MSKKYSVIGSSAAGIGCVSRLRTLDKSAEITMVTASQLEPYNTCLLADMLSGERERSQIQTKPLSFFTENNIELRSGTKLEEINPEDKFIRLSDGKKHSYDALFLGLGTRARMLSIPGADLSGIFSFHTLQDVCALQDFVKDNQVKHATIIGAGLSGVECADSLIQQGIKVTIVERSNRVLPHQVDEQGSQVIVDAMSRDGVTFIPEATAVQLNGEQGRVQEVHLANGQVIKTDMVIATIGGIVNSVVAHEAGIQLVNGRVKTDEFLQTSIPGIFAGGDMCVVRDALSREYVPNTTWPDAMMQGMFAAFNMVGQERKYPGVQTVSSSNFFGLTFVSCGPVTAEKSFEKEIIKNEKDAYHAYVFDGTRLCGFLMVGDVTNVGQLRKLVLQRAPHEQIRLLNNL